MTFARDDFAALLGSIHVVIWEVSAETGGFTYVSRAAERLLGFPRELWLKDPQFFHRQVHPDDHKRVTESTAAAIAAQSDHELEFRMLRADGSTVWVHALVAIVPDEAGPGKLRGALIDVTERKSAESALAVSSERLRNVIANAPIVLFTLDAEGTIQLVEGAAMANLGLQAGDIVGKHPTDATALSAQIRRNLLRALGGEEFSEVVHFQERVFDTRYTPIRDADERPAGLIGVATDITERVQAERARRELEGQLLRTQKLESLGVMAGGIAHDFNNLLTTIIGNCEMALGEDALPAVRSRLQRSVRAARSAADLTNQLLAYAGYAHFEPRPVDMSDLVASTSDLLQVAASRKVALEADLQPDLPAVRGDATQLQQVLLNLVRNASEALSGRGGTVRVRTGIVNVDAGYRAQSYLADKLPARPYVFLEVSDGGVGMDEATKARIFDPFFTTKFDGRGLGLAAVLGIVRSHGGSVAVYSEPGRGSTFRVLLPIEADAVATIVAPPAAPPIAALGGGDVLVVDDEEDICEITGAFLEDLGFRVLVARSGDEAEAMAREHGERIRAVVLDMTMPERGGEEVARALRPLLADSTPIVLMSGYSEAHVRELCRPDAPDAFLQKPFSPEQLAEALRGVLRNGLR